MTPDQKLTLLLRKIIHDKTNPNRHLAAQAFTYLRKLKTIHTSPEETRCQFDVDTRLSKLYPTPPQTVERK